MDTPWLSVLMPTFNGEEFIGEALDSVVAQDESNIEVIVVDDGSKDATVQIVESYRDRLELRLIQLPEVTNNWVKKTNYALREARAEHTNLLFQDDLWYPGRLAKMKGLLDRNPHASLFLHAARYIGRGPEVFGSWHCPLPPQPKILESNLVMSRLLVQNFISPPAPIFKTQIALDIHGLNEDLVYTADWEFWLRYIPHAKTVYLPEILSAFRLLPVTETIRQSADADSFRGQLDFVLQKHLPVLDGNRNLQARNKETR